MSANCRPPLHQSILCILYCSPFLKKSPPLYKCFVSVFQSYLYIFHPWCYIRFTYILDTNFCQLQTSLTPINLVHLAFFSIPYKMHDAQDLLVWGRSSVGRHWYQECKLNWSNTNDEIYYGNTGKLRHNTCTREVTEYRIVYGMRVLYK